MVKYLKNRHNIILIISFIFLLILFILFIFPKEDNYNFWMKNTLIPLDIIWISKNEEIVFIEKNVLPCKEDPCQIYTSPKKVLYVLEINSGQTEEIRINIGDKIMIS